MKIDYRNLPTEKQNPSSKNLDRLSISRIVRIMNREDQKVPAAVGRESKNIAEAAGLMVRSLKSGGRIFFAGAGTSGRLGVLESAEMPPTFNTPPGLAQAIMAGGRKAVFRSREGAEDDGPGAKREVAKRVRRGDILIGIAASGVTPFVREALKEARKRRAKTVLVTCNMKTAAPDADVVIAPNAGPEIIAGSTRLKSATAAKMVLNMLTASSMVHLGKVYGNWMVDLQPKSKKLRERGLRLLQDIAGLSRRRAETFFKKADGNVKTAIVMAKKGLDRNRARRLLNRFGGFIGPALRP